MGLSSDLWLEQQMDDWIDDMSYDYDYDDSTLCNFEDYDVPTRKNTGFYIKAVGVTYGDRQNVIKQLNVGDALYFVLEKNNVFDPYAVLIVTESGDDIGYVNKKYSKNISQNIKRGISFKLTVANITHSPEECSGNDYLGVNIKISAFYSGYGDYSENREEKEFFIIKNYVLESYAGKNKNIVIPNEVISIGKKAFENSSFIENVILPEGIKEIQDFAFYKCKNLKKINFPSTISHIGESAFENCESLKSIILPKNLTVIENSTFASCLSLEQVILPQNLKEIKRAVFYRCEALKEIQFPESLYSIDLNSFAFCNSLTSVCVPKNVAVIGEWVFHDCENLKEAKILGDIVSIGGNPFSHCNKLKTIILSESAKTYLRRHGYCHRCGGLLTGFIFKSCIDCERAGRF